MSRRPGAFSQAYIARGLRAHNQVYHTPCVLEFRVDGTVRIIPTVQGQTGTAAAEHANDASDPYIKGLERLKRHGKKDK